MDNTISARALASAFPQGEIAWDGMTGGTMRELSDGIAVTLERERIESAKIIKNFFPNSTELVKEWEDTFRLPSGEALTPIQRAKRLVSMWQKISPGSFDGMNEIYALSGLSVHARPLKPGEDPRVIAEGDHQRTIYLAVCGPTVCSQTARASRYGAKDTIPATAETVVFADGRPGAIEKNYISRYGSFVCSPTNPASKCGAYQGYNYIPSNITIPDDEWTWPMIYIIEDFSGNFAQVPIALRGAFRFLTYKIKPNFMWAISRVEFI